VVDPEGSVVPGAVHRIPFLLTEHDFGSDVVLLSPWSQLLTFRLETPEGDLITPTNVGAVPGAELEDGEMIRFYRVSIPALVNGTQAGAGLWHALVSVGDQEFKDFLTIVRRETNNDKAALVRARTQGIPYNLSVQALSNLHLDAQIITTGHEPGAAATLRAVLTEIGLPVDHRASVRVELLRPDDTQALLYLSEVEPGVFEAAATLTQAGVYRARFLAEGKTLRGTAFTREAIRTAGIAPQADHQPPPGEAGGHDWCKFIRCLAEDGGILERLGINPEHLRQCLDELCGYQAAE